MQLGKIAFSSIALVALAGCAATISQEGLEQRTAQSIGRSVDQITISERTEEDGGRINYTVNTRDGKTYRCYLYSATAFQKGMSFGQIPHSDAVCTAIVASKSGHDKPSLAASEPSRRGNNGDCNALLRAAGRC